MENIYEITIIGRGGQGAKTASEVIAGAALKLGKYIQSFSEYGAERSGAPIFSYIRISDEPIKLHSGVLDPNLIMVMDDTLISLACPTANTKVIVNTLMPLAKIREEMEHEEGEVYTVNSTGISVEIIGKNIPNTPSLGAISKIMGTIPKEKIIDQLRYKLESKIGKGAMDKNVQCLERAYDEVKEAE